MHKTLKAAIIGNGFGRYGLAPAFLAHPDVKLHAVCTRQQSTANQLAEACGVSLAFDDWHRLLEEPLDLLAIATPPIVQQEISLAALDKKIPLFLEKQVAADSDRSAELLRISKQHQIKNCVNFIFPYLKTWQLLPAYLSKIGDIRQVFISWRMESYDNRLKTTSTWKTNDALGGGILQHFLSHLFFYIEHYFGSIKQLKCTLAKTDDINDVGSTFASLDLLMSQGFMVQIAASSAAYQGAGHVIEIYGSKGSILLSNKSTDPVSGFELFFAARGEQYHSCGLESALCDSNFDDNRVAPTAYLLQQFVADLQGGRSSPYPNLGNGHRVQHLIGSAYLASKAQAFVNT